MAMTRTVANTNDLNMTSTHTNVVNARSGTNFDSVGVSGASIFNAMGMAKGGPGLTAADYQMCECFFRFEWPAVPATHDLVSAWFDIRHDYYEGNVLRNILYLEHDFGGAPDLYGDWVPVTSLNTKALMAEVPDIAQSSFPFRPYTTGGNGLFERLKSGNGVALDILGCTSREYAVLTPTTSERNGAVLANYAEDIYRPNLRVLSLAKSTLAKMGGASAQLSDGTSVFVDDYELKWSTNNIVDNDIGSLPTGTGTLDFDDDTVGWQTMSIAVDADDNIWVVGKGGLGGSSIVIAPFLKGAGNTWAAQTVRRFDAPAFTNNPTSLPVNNVSACWHPTANAGMLMVMMARRAGAGRTGQVSYAKISCNNLLAGVSFVISSGINPAWLGMSVPTDQGNRQANDTGNGLDVHANGLYGYAICWDGTFNASYYNPMIRAGRYLLTSSGAFASTLVWSEDDTPIELEPETKAKIIVIDGSKIALCYGDRIHVYDNAGTRIVEGASIGTQLYTQGVDWLYDRATDRIWVYYMSAARTLSRRGFSLTTGTYTADTTISAAVGAVGSTNPHIRLPRGVSNERTVRIEVGNRTSGGALSTIVFNDTLNVAPLAPTLGNRADFNAAAPATFLWTFSDKNTDDRQSAYQLRIYDQASPAVVVYDSGKVASTASQHILPASTLTNAHSYNWEVRTWDIADAVGPYSAQQNFQTVSTAITTITVPAVDNPPDATNSFYQISWSTTVIAQAKYRVVLVDTQSLQTVLDTGWVVSTATTYLLQGLLDGVQYRVDVTVRSNVDVESATGSRLITPDYIPPMTPVVTLTPDDVGGFILVQVSNPTPTGSEPEPIRNDLFRSLSGEDDFIKIKEMANDGSYKDYNVRSGLAYDYFVRAVV